jgi:hypothetical protein
MFLYLPENLSTLKCQAHSIPIRVQGFLEYQNARNIPQPTKMKKPGGYTPVQKEGV